MALALAYLPLASFVDFALFCFLGLVGLSAYYAYHLAYWLVWLVWLIWLNRESLGLVWVLIWLTIVLSFVHLGSICVIGLIGSIGLYILSTSISRPYNS